MEQKACRLRRAAATAGILAALACEAGAAPDPRNAVAGDTPKWTVGEIKNLRAAGQRVPAYMTQEWGPPQRLLVWAKPGKSGRLSDPKNWLLDGKPLTGMSFEKPGRGPDAAAFDAETDLLLPDADKPYTVGYASRGQGGMKARHITIGNNAMLHPSVLLIAGNLWVKPKGKLRARYSLNLTGDRHVFFHNDKLRFTADKNNALAGGHPAATYVNGIGYEVSQYFGVRKTKGKSVEFLGTMQTSDDFQMPSGVTIVAPNAQLMPGKRSTQQLGRAAVLRLHSGSQFCKMENATYYLSDLVVHGRIEAGTKKHPITRDCLLGISFKDRSTYGKGGGATGTAAPGLVFMPTAEVAVHTADSSKARLAIRWHGRENNWQRKRMKAESGRNYMAFPRTIDIEIRGSLALEAVLFDDVGAGGIRAADPAIHKTWKAVSFGRDNAVSPEELFAKLATGHR